MLREIRLSSFKCFERVRIPLRDLTLFTGFNGTGKSTTAQALLLIHEAVLNDVDIAGIRSTLPLNGATFALGSVRDVVDKLTGGESFQIGITWDDRSITWDLGSRGSPRDELVALVRSVSWSNSSKGSVEETFAARFLPPGLLDDSVCRGALDAIAGLCYVPADRMGPAETYPLDDPRQHRTFGKRAELAVGNLLWRRDDVVLEGLRHPDRSHAPTFPRQAEAWLAHLFPGIAIDVQPVPNANLVRLALRNNPATDFHRPQHVGFGITYVLPVILALLGGRVGDLILLDSPEAHLHPRAQSLVGTLCARAAQSGVQVLLETHSDHVVNGVRLAVHRGEVAPDKVSCLFFREAGETPIELRMDGHGGFDQWPSGFFDESIGALDQLLTERPASEPE
jgi:predicted ATPase